MSKLSEDWILGFTWGIGTISDSRLYIRYHDKELLEQICIALAIQNRPYNLAEGKIAVKINLKQPFCQRLLALGWTGRFHEDRQYPDGEINHLDFIRGYCYTKTTYEPQKPRLRIYGSIAILQAIDNYLVSNINTVPKKIQVCRGRTQDGYIGQCYALYYQSKIEVARIAELLKPGRP